MRHQKMVSCQNKNLRRKMVKLTRPFVSPESSAPQTKAAAKYGSRFCNLNLEYKL